jgi:tetratricopeptide (TPR) repeat protein
VSETTDPAARAIRHGHALLEMGRPEEAAAAFAQAAASDPTLPAAHIGLALAHLRTSDFKASCAAAERAVGADPQSEWARRLLAIALMRLGKSRPAREHALRAVELAPEQWHGFVVLAEALLGVGDLAGAEAAAERARALAPEECGPHTALSLVKLRHEDWRAAEQAAREALARDPQNVAALVNLAAALHRQGRRQEAGEIFDQAGRSQPHNGAIRRGLVRLSRTQAGAGFSPATKQLVADERRARRLKPHRWDWGRVRRLRPWWWVALTRMPAPAAFAVNAALFALLLAASLHASGPTAVWAILLGLGLLASTRRLWRWWRIRHPSRRSWRPDGADG